MKSIRIISSAAALFLASTLLSAAPDRNNGNNDNYSRSYQHTYSDNDKGKNNPKAREKAQKQQTPSRTGAKPVAPHQMQRQPSQSPQGYNPSPSREEKRKSITRVPPSAKKQAPAKIIRREGKHAHYYRPPGAKPLPYYHRPGYKINTLPRLAITFTIGGLTLYYTDGIYYRHASGGFIVSAPPAGILISTLPPGYTVFMLNGLTYYYYADVYYIRDGYRGYRVVQPPVVSTYYHPGEIVDTLPDGAYSTTINGIQYYRYGDLYFMQAVQGDRIVYIVVTP